ncbi:hypothetical protein SAMN02745216_04161 [Desulfatibacillum alkenivorans DSM 16219]|uniref:Uncharacterized protein n=1 Tax=Desulfatibacillum alkenivorans DSM 16219 TaxID=1121393 RepID=A0A1M6VQK8_9BACT|nr:tetratricopeptide repeat protein [Desulfatibacillum alkenivorans]SHK83621.1 hypothetical protein SAMN02745216_04161 [Desulfatibacillum alkenivorans DSM 16219]
MNNNNRAEGILALLIISGIILAAFSPLLANHSFLWDDELNLLQNPRATSPDLNGIIRYWTEPYLNMYIPVVYSAWSLIAMAGQALGLHDGGGPLSPWLFHVVNLFFHLINGLLLYLLLEKLVKNKPAAAIGALLFALHPVQAEAASYITELKTLMAFAFSVGAMNIYYAYKLNPKKNGALPIGAAAGAFLLFVLALLSKPTAVVAPVFIFIINLLVLDWGCKKSIKEAAPWFLVIIPFLIITKSVQPPYSHQFVSSMGERILIYGDAIAHYMAKTAYPAPLGIDYGRTPQNVLNTGWGYFAWIIPAVIAGGLLILGKKARPYLAGALIFIAGFGPVSGLSPFVFQTISTVADRYMYFSMAGVSLIAALIIARQPHAIVKGVAGAVLLALGLLVNLQVRTWDGNENLYIQAIKANPNSAMSYNNLASQYMHGTTQGLMFYHRAFTLKPDHAVAVRNLCSSILSMRNEHPAQNLRFLVRPEDQFKAVSYYNYAVNLARTEDYSQSLLWMGKALALDLFNPKILNNYAVLCWKIKDYKTARTLFELAGELYPESPDIAENILLTLPRPESSDTKAENLIFFNAIKTG